MGDGFLHVGAGGQDGGQGHQGEEAFLFLFRAGNSGHAHGQAALVGPGHGPQGAGEVEVGVPVPGVGAGGFQDVQAQLGLVDVVGLAQERAALRVAAPQDGAGRHLAQQAGTELQGHTGDFVHLQPGGQAATLLDAGRKERFHLLLPARQPGQGRIFEGFPHLREDLFHPGKHQLPGGLTMLSALLEGGSAGRDSEHVSHPGCYSVWTRTFRAGLSFWWPCPGRAIPRRTEGLSPLGKMWWNFSAGTNTMSPARACTG